MKIIVIFILLSLIYSCGSNNLGHDIYLMEGDRREDRVIVKCSGLNFGNCSAGTYLIPTYSEHYDSAGNYREYVENAKSNKKYILANTVIIETSEKRYWIISKKEKDLIIGPLSYDSFTTELKGRKIKIKI